MGKYFGTDGFRGEVNIDLNPIHAYLIGSFFGNLANKVSGDDAKVVIGSDTRKSGDMLVNALVSGVTAAGSNCYVLGTVPTPGVAFVTRNFDFDFGVMVSASHNPFYDNGIKVLNSNGEKLSDDIIDKCEKYIDAGPEKAILAKKENIGTSKGYRGSHLSYIHSLKNCVNHKFKGLKIALDCANGSASDFAGELFTSLGANVEVFHNDPNGININVNCGSTHIETLGKYVRGGNFDMGFAFDGDADRCLAVDKNGNEVNGDALMFLCARRFKKEGRLDNNTVVTTIMSNFGLYKAFDKLGIDYVKTAVGDRYVYENMLNNGHILGGEQSGHIIFKDFATTGDGMLTALVVTDSLIEMGETLDEAVKDLKMYPQVLKNVTVDSKETTMQDTAVKKAVEEAEKMLKGDGRVLVRPSGTEPYVRVMAEASTDELCEKAVNSVIEVMKKQGHVVK